MNTIQEAKRCLTNAREILREKALKEDGNYLDSNYVKIAGNTAYSGIILALDDFLGKKGKGPKDVEWYKQHLSKWDKKVCNAFSTAYQILYLDMASDGDKSIGLVLTGFEEADKIIGWLESKVAIA